MTASDSPSEPASGPTPERAAPLVGRRRNVLLTLGTNMAIMGFTFVSGTLNARILEPVGRGELAAIQTIPSVLGSIAVLGLPSAVGYLSARHPREARRLTLTGAALCLAAMIPAVILGYLILPWALQKQRPVVVDTARIYLLYSLLFAVVNVAYSGLQGIGAFGAWNILRLTPYLATVLAIGLAWIAGDRSAGGFAVRHLILSWIPVPIVYVALWRNSRRPPPESGHRVGEMVRYGLPNALMVPANLLNLQLDQILMAGWLRPEIAGLYAVGASWGALIGPVIGALGSILFPALAASPTDEGRGELIARSMRSAITVALVVSAGLAVVTPLMLPIINSQLFRPAVPAALILVAAGAVLAIANLSGEILRGLGAPRWPLYGQLAALPVTAVLLLLLLPRWSIVGAAITSLVAYAVTAAVGVVGIRRACRLSFRELLVPTGADLALLAATVRGVLLRRLG